MHHSLDREAPPPSFCGFWGSVCKQRLKYFLPLFFLSALPVAIRSTVLPGLLETHFASLANNTPTWTTHCVADAEGNPYNKTTRPAVCTHAIEQGGSTSANYRTAAALAQFVLVPVFGAASDVVGRRPFIMLGSIAVLIQTAVLLFVIRTADQPTVDGQMTWFQRNGIYV